MKQYHGCVTEILDDIIKIQDLIIYLRTKYFGRMLANIVRTDTIPLIFFTVDGFLKLTGCFYNKITGKAEMCSTMFFRIEIIDPTKNCATVSLLFPTDSCGNDMPYYSGRLRLTRTDVRVTVDLSGIIGVQPLDTGLMAGKL